MDILIIGAGPTGLTAACELYRRGFTPRIIDKKDGPSPLSRAVGVNARSLELLEASGITEKLLQRGNKTTQLRIHEGAKTIGTIYVDRLPHRYNFLLALPQNKTEELMIETLESYGGAVEFENKMTALSYDAAQNKAHVTINDTEEHTYDLVIAADGVRSPVREALNIPFEGHDYEQHWSIADFESKNWSSDADLFLLPDGGVRFLIKIGAHRYRLVANQPEALPNMPIDLGVEEIHHTGDFKISVRQAKTYQSDCIYLAGDAAHAHSPAGGRGMNLGIDDACDLAARIAEGNLEGYTTARHPVGKATLEMSENMVKAATASSPIIKIVRRVLLATISTFPFLQVSFLRGVSGLKG